MKHTIKKQVLLLAVDARLDAFALQQAASNYYWGRIVPALEKLFDQLSGEGEWVRLDKLEIDLGRITEDVLQERELDQQLYGLIREQLREALAGTEPEKGALPGRETPAGHALRQWWYYMEHGRLHWGQRAPSAAWYGQVLELLSVDYAAAGRLRETIPRQPHLLERIVAQHGDEFLERLAGILVAEKMPDLRAWIEAIVRLGGLLEAAGGGADGDRAGRKSDEGVESGSIRHRWAVWRQRHLEFLSAAMVRRKEVVWRFLFRSAAEQGSLFRGGGAATLLLQWLTDDDAVLLRYLRIKSPVLPSGMQWPPMDKAAMGRQRAQESSLEEKTGLDEVVGVSDRKERAPESRESADAVDEEGIYVPHAGIILLHPFLATCFSRLRWWEEGRFADEGARENAVFLLHYLATGQRGEIPEYALAFPKIVCGWPAGTPMPAQRTLAEEAYAEGDGLLEMVLQRWDKLSGSSIDGLREGFLQREGKLIRRGAGIGLLVEQQAIDVLLESLPWNLGVVKLPWLKEIIYIEWR